MCNTKDLQTSVYQNIKQKYGEQLYQYLLKHNNSQYIAVNLGNSQSLISECNSSIGNSNGDSIIFTNPKLTKANSMSEFENLLHFLSHLTLRRIANLSSYQNTDCLINQIVDQDMLYKWSATHLNDLLLIANQSDNLVCIFENFSTTQNYHLAKQIVADLDKVEQVVAQNGYAINLLLIISASTNKYKYDNTSHILLQFITDTLAKHNYICDNYCLGKMLNSVNNLTLDLPLKAIGALISEGNNPYNQYTFTAYSYQDVIDFLTVVEQADNKIIDDNFAKEYNYHINFNSFKQVITDHKNGLQKALAIMPECQDQLDKLNTVLNEKC